MTSASYEVDGAMTLSRAKLRNMHHDLWRAIGYNLIALPIAAGVLYAFLLSPQIAALAMLGGLAFVAVDTLLLKRTRLGGIMT